MRASHAILSTFALCAALAAGQALAQSTGATPQTSGGNGSGAPPDAGRQSMPTQTTPQSTTSPQQQGTTQSGTMQNGTTNGSSMNNGDMNNERNGGNSGTYGKSRRAHSTNGTHTNRGTLDSNNGSNYPATSSSVH